jgi:hypothetical protein
VSRDASLLPPFIPPRDLARWTAGLLVATAALAWIAVGVDLSELRLLLPAGDGTAVSHETRWAQLKTTSWLFRVQTLCFAATSILFLIWLYQARVNVRALGARRLHFERRWAVLGFVVPLLNVFRPYQVMREVWQASDPRVEDGFGWKTVPVPPLLPRWWGCFVAWGALLLLTGLSEIGAGANLAKIQLSASLQLLTDATAGVAATLACFLVLRLSDNQQEKWELQQRAEAGTPAGAAAPTLWAPLSTSESDGVS